MRVATFRSASAAALALLMLLLVLPCTGGGEPAHDGTARQLGVVAVDRDHACDHTKVAGHALRPDGVRPGAVPQVAPEPVLVGSLGAFLTATSFATRASVLSPLVQGEDAAQAVVRLGVLVR